MIESSFFDDFFINNAGLNLNKTKRRLSFIFYPAVETNHSIMFQDHNVEENLHNKMNGELFHIRNGSSTAISTKLGKIKSASIFKDNPDNGRFKQELEVYENDDLCNSLRMFLRFGKILGIIPINGLFARNVSTEDLKFSWYSLSSIYNYIVILMLVINFLVGTLNVFVSKKSEAFELALACAMSLFYFMGIFTYVYFLRNSHQFIKLFQTWKNMKTLYFSTYEHFKNDTHLFRDTNLIAGLIFTSAILENMLLFCLQSQILTFPNEKIHLGSAMDTYYHRSHLEWLRIYNHTNTVTSVNLGYFVFFSNKFALYSWNYADAMIIILSRAIYYKFQVLNCVAEKQLMNSEANNDDQQWKQLTMDHTILCQLLSELEHFLSPVIMTCYATNTFFICLQIKLGLTESSNTNFVSSLYYIWSLLHLLARVYMVSLSAARVNEYVHDIRKIYQSCPTRAYTLEVQRAEMYLGTTQIGLTGLRCFVITKPFLLTIIGVVFTLEIVLLQPV